VWPCQLCGRICPALLFTSLLQVRDYKNNESVLATFCMLLRNISSSGMGRQIISRNLYLRKRLITYMQTLLVQEALKMNGYVATGSDSRNLMTAEACACLWKMVQPYEPENSRRERIEKTEALKKSNNKKTKPPEPFMESFILEDVVNGKQGENLAQELLALLKVQGSPCCYVCCRLALCDPC
jgi:hypothetical protein